MKFNVHIFVFDLEAESEAEAKSLAHEYLYELAGSNDGSEVLANARPILTQVN